MNTIKTGLNNELCVYIRVIFNIYIYICILSTLHWYMCFTYGCFNKQCLLIKTAITDCIYRKGGYGLDDPGFESP